jgi:putative transposase
VCVCGYGRRQAGWQKELVAIQDGYGESTQSWACLLLHLKRRGMRAPVLALGDGAWGLCSAVRDVFQATLHQGEWVHKTANVLDAVPKSVHRRAKAAIKEITCAKSKAHPSRPSPPSSLPSGQKGGREDNRRPRGTAALLGLSSREHCPHLKSTNPIESRFALVRARTDLRKGPGSREAGLAMIFKLLEAAQGRWRRLKGSHLVALVRTGAKF